MLASTFGRESSETQDEMELASKPVLPSNKCQRVFQGHFSGLSQTGYVRDTSSASALKLVFDKLVTFLHLVQSIFKQGGGGGEK